MDYPLNEEMLDNLLSEPDSGLVEMMKRLPGDIMILGINGKMGLTLGRLAVNAVRAAGGDKQVIGVSRFGDAEGRRKLEEWGIKTIACDLLDRKSVRELPQAPNVIFMAGRKFGTDGAEDLTWAMNVLAPAYVGEHFKDSRIVAFSTGCVYPLVGAETGGCTESVVPDPVGDYSQSCLGRERIFSYCSRTYGTKVLLFRLNYAIDLRYGVLHDIAARVWNNQAVDNTVGHFNVIWQGDANNSALRCLEYADSPAAVLNITGPEIIPVEYIAGKFGKLLERPVTYAGSPGGKCYLNNASRSFSLFGYPRMPLEKMIELQAEWFRSGGRSLGKPTHFEVNNGKF